MLIPMAYFVEERLHFGQRFILDFLPTDGDHLIDGAIPDDFAHDGFGNVAEGFARFPDLEKELDGIRDAVLNHPFHQCGVQVTRHHLRFPLSIAGTLIRIAGTLGREPEFLLQLPFDGNDCRGIDAQRQLEMQSRGNLLEILAETLDDGDRITRHSVIGRPRTEAGEDEDCNDDRSA